MKGEFSTPAMDYIKHVGNLTKDEIANMPETELIEYLKQQQFAEKAKLYRVNQDYLIREITGEYVLIPVGSSAQQLNGMVALNETFHFIWEQFQEPHTAYDVVIQALKQFEGSVGEIERDINDCIEAMLQYGFLKEED